MQDSFLSFECNEKVFEYPLISKCNSADRQVDCRVDEGHFDEMNRRKYSSIADQSYDEYPMEAMRFYCSVNRVFPIVRVDRIQVEIFEDDYSRDLGLLLIYFRQNLDRLNRFDYDAY